MSIEKSRNLKLMGAFNKTEFKFYAVFVSGCISYRNIKKCWKILIFNFCPKHWLKFLHYIGHQKVMDNNIWWITVYRVAQNTGYFMMKHPVDDVMQDLL